MIHPAGISVDSGSLECVAVGQPICTLSYDLHAV